MEQDLLSVKVEASLLHSLHCSNPVSGFTHNFYRYPARMSPDFAREAIDRFSEPGDIVLDPFLGGGTTMVEAIAAGRRSIGVDLNPLATFVSAAKTTPLSTRDVATLTQWASDAPILETSSAEFDVSSMDPRLKNLPLSLVQVFGKLLRNVLELPYPRQRKFARCALLRLGQLAVDRKSGIPGPSKLRSDLQQVVQEMLAGLELLVESAAVSGIQKRYLTQHRTIMLRSTVGFEEDLDLLETGRPRLVLTSPPYPAVHVLYHRWQVDGRRETAAPYWLMDSPDGHGLSYFTMGSRTPFGIDNYFQSLTAAFSSVRAVIDPKGFVLQLVSFSDAETQLVRFLQAMEDAGFKEDAASEADRAERWRTVPNRRWYYRIDATRKSARELLLIHRPDGAVSAT